MSQFGIRATSGSASINSYGNQITGPASGSNYFAVSTGDSPTFTIFQLLNGLYAGTLVHCSVKFNFPGDRQGYASSFTISLRVDGQLCGRTSTFQSSGWQSLENQVVTTTDNPYVEVILTLNNVYGNRLYVGLDDLIIIPASQSQLPLCAVEPPTSGN